MKICEDILNQGFIIILYWLIGLSLIVVQCLFEPMALKSVADVLQCDQIEVRKLIGYLAFLLVSTFASPIVKVVSNVIRERLVPSVNDFLVAPSATVSKASAVIVPVPSL